MTEYIERDAVLNDIAELFTLCHETLPNECGHHFIVENELKTHLDFVKNLPAADVRPAVLCRDCKWTKTDGMDDPAIYCKKWDRWEMPPDGFCWLGKKREDDDGT